MDRNDSHEHHHSHNHHEHEQVGHVHLPEDRISISTHEESIIAVFKSHIAAPYQEAVGIVGRGMKNVAEEVVENGGIIGHIKSFVIAEGERCMISISDAGTEAQEKHIPGESANFELVVIVFHVDEDTLRGIIHSIFPE
ncbi:hypothetical protein TREPR_1960 [Treponema primitia ZAS-2]|uniref:Uncharacterized protein n=1 Tax=Treponema primitia (strain ATCC BAA-887 / DSM 12427 / ZAS-2) TaxID=545694 RepID=F5YKH4_TREPZ|nr:hypothetical protein [Treponema primitia]AEF85293.1 hypothetical protein TREPR_1960 [Treponema primitia ZAS-2]